MEGALTHDNELVRGRAVLLLAEVLSRLPSLRLSPVGVESLVTFFEARTEDYP